jgi:type I restriction enzyme S subunit
VALFPDRLVESELGPAPEGWRVGIIGEVALVNRQSISSGYPYKTIEYIDISSVTEGKVEQTTTYLLSEAPSRARRLVEHGDTIWSTVRPNRKSYLFIHTPPRNLVVSTGFAVLSPCKVPPNYLYCWVIREEFVEYLTYNATGSAYPAVNANRFVDAKILVPPQQLLQKFEEIVEPIRDRIAHNDQESRTLAELRDVLLPKLISGQLRVPAVGIGQDVQDEQDKRLSCWR